MTVRQISIPSVGPVAPTSSFLNINFILGMIAGGLLAAIIAMILWPKFKENMEDKSYST